MESTFRSKLTVFLYGIPVKSNVDHMHATCSDLQVKQQADLSINWHCMCQMTWPQGGQPALSPRS